MLNTNCRCQPFKSKYKCFTHKNSSIFLYSYFLFRADVEPRRVWEVHVRWTDLFDLAFCRSKVSLQLEAVVELDEGFGLPTHFHQYIPFTKEALQQSDDISSILRVFLMLVRITKGTGITHKTGFVKTIKTCSWKTVPIYSYMSVCYKTAELWLANPADTCRVRWAGLKWVL